MSMGSSLRSLVPRLRNSIAPSSSSSSFSICKRSIHQRTALPFSEDHALEPFLSAEGVRTVAVEYQQGLLDRLNDAVRGTEHEHSSVYQTVIDTAGVQSDILTFNYACQALNNAFFLSRLTSKQEELSSATHPLLTRNAENSFGGITGLKATFSSAAMGMFGNGWIWLVMNRKGVLGVIPTYGTGTVLIQHRQERIPLNTLVSASESNKQKESSSSSSTSSSSSATPSTSEQEPTKTQQKPASSSSPNHNLYLQKILHGSTKSRSLHDVFPLLALSVHEHSWIKDYGIWGKEQYVRNFWDAVDWTKIESAIQSYRITA